MSVAALEMLGEVERALNAGNDPAQMISPRQPPASMICR
jgi:hypothetical protein